MQRKLVFETSPQRRAGRGALFRAYNPAVAQWREYAYSGTSGERLDSVLTRLLEAEAEFAGLSRSRVQALIEAGGVKVGGQPAARGQKNLRPGMAIGVDLEALRGLLKPPAAADLAPAEIPIEVLHEDAQLLVVLKPAGISTHPAPTDSGPSLAGALLHRFGQLADAGGADRPGIVHRLDKETSGLLVIARDNLTHSALSAQFARRTVEKEYLALCLAPPREAVGRVDRPIERHPRERQRMWAGGKGKPALTEYRLAEEWGPLALLEVALHTGRTHQIRVHLQTLALAILNDMKYGQAQNASARRFLKTGNSAGLRKEWAQALGSPEKRASRSELLALLEAYPGIFLCARRLAFTHPQSGARLEFSAEPPKVWAQVHELIVSGSDA